MSELEDALREANEDAQEAADLIQLLYSELDVLETQFVGEQLLANRLGNAIEAYLEHTREDGVRFEQGVARNLEMALVDFLEARERV